MNKLFHFIYFFNKMDKIGEKELTTTTTDKALIMHQIFQKKTKKLWIKQPKVIILYLFLWLG